MQLILAILLYLRVIVSPGSYTEKQIQIFIEQNRTQIDAVQNDKAKMDQIKEIYVPQTDGIIIIQSEDD